MPKFMTVFTVVCQILKIKSTIKGISIVNFGDAYQHLSTTFKPLILFSYIHRLLKKKFNSSIIKPTSYIFD